MAEGQKASAGNRDASASGSPSAFKGDGGTGGDTSESSDYSCNAC